MKVTKFIPLKYGNRCIYKKEKVEVGRLSLNPVLVQSYQYEDSLTIKIYFDESINDSEKIFEVLREAPKENIFDWGTILLCITSVFDLSAFLDCRKTEDESLVTLIFSKK